MALSESLEALSTNFGKGLLGNLTRNALGGLGDLPISHLLQPIKALPPPNPKSTYQPGVLHGPIC